MRRKVRLAPRSTVSRHHTKVARLEEQERAREWRAATVRAGCVMCHHFPVDHATRHVHAADLRRIEAHHVLAQRHLKLRGLHEHLWDERNGLGLCSYHHARHERFTQRVPRALLPWAVHEFAAALRLDWLLDREYPPPETT